MDAEAAAEVDEWARANGVRCAYFLASVDDAATPAAAAAAGFRLVDLRVELTQRLEGAETATSLRHASGADLPALAAIARTSHTDTRFYADPNFPDARCDDLYATWIERSVGGWADAVLVPERVDGYVSCHADAEERRGSIGLIAVAASARGHGRGQELVRGALAWMRSRGLEEAAVATQGRNVGAQRTFQRCGFVTASIGLWFHKWYGM